MSELPDASARPLLIGGMHRSGTSLTASLVASAGIDLGPELLGCNFSNPLGHFEDLGFQDLHARALVAQGLGGEGYTATHRGEVPAVLEPEAGDILAARMHPGVAWGWKEPRTTLFLDFWQERLPHARHMFVFRRPWEVADSLFRRGDATFVLNPSFAFAVWTHYNRLIVDFVRRHPAQSMVFEISQVITDPHRVLAAVRSRLDVPLGTLTPQYQPDLFKSDDKPTRAALVRAMAPEAWQTYLELRALAGSGDEIDTARRQDASLSECAVIEWAWASRAESEARRRAESEARQRDEERRRKSRDRFAISARFAQGATVAKLVESSRRLLAPRQTPAAKDPAAELPPFPRVAAATPTTRVA